MTLSLETWSLTAVDNSVPNPNRVELPWTIVPAPALTFKCCFNCCVLLLQHSLSEQAEVHCLHSLHHACTAVPDLESPVLHLSNILLHFFNLVELINTTLFLFLNPTLKWAQTLTIYWHEFHFKLHRCHSDELYEGRTWSINKGLSKLGVTSCPMWFQGLCISLHAVARVICISSRHEEWTCMHDVVCVTLSCYRAVLAAHCQSLKGIAPDGHPPFAFLLLPTKKCL